MGRLTLKEGGYLGAQQARRKEEDLGEEGCCCGLSASKRLSTELAASKQQPWMAQRSRERAAVWVSRSPHTQPTRMHATEWENTGAEPLRSSSRSLSWLLPAALGSEPHSHCAQSPFPTTPRKGKGQNICPRVSMIPTATVRAENLHKPESAKQLFNPEIPEC